jgi:hypothetical protein
MIPHNCGEKIELKIPMTKIIQNSMSPPNLGLKSTKSHQRTHSSMAF